MGFAVLSILSWIVFLCLGSATSAESIESVRAALDAQDAWLSTSPKGDAWRRYLESDGLRSQLDQGSAADKRALARILGRYESGVEGLSSSRFVRTRDELRGWANRLGVPLSLRWASRIRSAAEVAPEISAAELSDARQQLTESTNRLSQFLDSGGLENADAWRDYLQWSSLQEQLAAEETDWDEMDQVVNRFYGGQLGLEYPQFAEVRNDLRRFVFLGKLAELEADAATQNISKQLGSLADAIVKYNDDPTTKNASQVAYLADVLSDLGQVSELTETVLSYHRHPNIQIRVTEDFLRRRFSRPVDETRNVDEMILRTRVRGPAHTTGNITADVIPDPHRARIDILFEGTTQTPSVGRQSPVTIYSHSTTTLMARKPLWLEPRNLLSEPAQATARTSTKIHRIEPDNRLGRRLVEKIAWQRAGSQKSASERIASYRAARRLERQFEQQAGEMLDRVRTTLRDQWRGPLSRRGLLPERIATSSTHDAVIVTAMQADDAQFSANGGPPAFNGKNAFSLQLHESAVNNTIERAIGGVLLTDEKVAEIVESQTGSVPAALQISDDQDPWSIQFDFQQPFTVQFEDQEVTFAIRARQFTSGERKLNSVEIAAKYAMEVASTGVVLRRRGDIEVEFLQRLSQPQQIFFRSLLRKKFSGLFTDVIQGEGFSLPGRWRNIGRLRLSEFSTDEGWLSLGWK